MFFGFALNALKTAPYRVSIVVFAQQVALLNMVSKYGINFNSKKFRELSLLFFVHICYQSGLILLHLGEYKHIIFWGMYCTQERFHRIHMGHHPSKNKKICCFEIYLLTPSSHVSYQAFV